MLELYLAPADGQWQRRIWPGASDLPPGTIEENSPYRLVLSGVSEPDSATLSIDGVPLEALRSPSRTSAAWQWNPGFFAGVIEVEIQIPARPTEFASIVVDPRAAKLCRDEYNLMVGQVLEDTLALFALSPFRYSVARGNGADRPPVARLEFLRSVFQKLENSLLEIERDPVRVLAAHQVKEELGRARNVRGLDLVRSFRHGRVQAVSPEMRERLGVGYLPERIDRPIKSEHFSTPEHARIKGFLRGAGDWLEAVSATLARTTPPEGSSRTMPIWARRTAKLARRCRELEDLAFLRGVAPSNGPLVLSEVFRKRPAYRRVLQVMTDWQLGIARIAGDFLQVPLTRTYDLYELWAFLRIAKASISYFGAMAVDTESLLDFDAVTGTLTLGTGSSRVRLDGGLRLCFQRNYREYWKEASGTGSFTREMIPDVAIETPDAKAVVVFDAKYRVESGLSDALTSVHTYRDAIVHADGNDDETRVVLGAYVVTPMVADALEGEWKETSMPRRLFHPIYRRKFRLGAICLRPGMSDVEVAKALSAVLDDVGFSPSKTSGVRP